MPNLYTEYIFDPNNFDGKPYKYIRCISAIKYDREGSFMDICKVHGPNPEDIVKNFDLTICENFYNGERVYSLYPEHVRTKKGFLEDHIAHEILNYNYTIGKGRVRKYISRGYTIFLRRPVEEEDPENKEILKITPQFLDTLIPETEFIFKINASKPTPIEKQ
jgi:hypothetical protein